ncbi:protein kinase DC2 isoform X1 [Drosophila persimilis]|uniref:cAMP-dependent protein kinase catalytic subunit 3 isoform X1 n=1 Tax=Drosophila pseudoobscura pseudoobscura TaxID=46245 RepID=A0A6I8W6A6_DROPS|nr:cAMP-dependent protein kinase catalytic subunit 3 isoform X1 [Drosophila pseudoobscura]XP_026845476.1 protein kinase DC2 isoform X1 [Drosophila persimilis]XP_026845477.1 protein kinase DC2 isoform X1 [Drosophila persimilis]XP_033238886.1 cAMP-dependent protein kinase catalytic subunit 3 isoform X1 [Drosophila pseudoobscura]
MSAAACARFCTPLTAGGGGGANKAKSNTSGTGSSSKLTTGTGNSSMTSSYKKKSPASDTNTEASFTFKLGRANGSSGNGSSSHGVGGGGGGHSVASSESSDPLESDYSEEEEEEPEPKPEQSSHVSSRSSSSATTTTSSADHENEVDEEEDDDDENDGDGRDGDDVTNDSNESIEEDDGNETDDEEDEDDSDESSSVQTAKGVRKYHLDDYQIIKTVGTGTFGRVCLCRDRISEKYCAMKILAMTEVIRLKQIEHVKNERNILREIRHPFVISLEWSTKDDSNLYMIFDYVCGGELFTYLRNAGKFTSQTSNFFAAEIVSALEYLHSLQIVYRDLKPENLLINRDGHLKITDFGFAKKLRDRTWTLCGTPEYIAPEIIQSKGHNKAVDWWALGVLIYEMLVGYPPFYDEQPFGIYEKILSGKIEWERHMDPIAKDLIKKLLVNDRTKRLGNMKNGADDVKRHRWFKHLNWNDVYNKKLKPPILPDVHHDGDTKNFDDYPEQDWKPAKAVDQRDLQYFNDF